MENFDYKKYSLEQLENWIHDAMSSVEVSSEEIFDTIKNVVEDNYYTYKNLTHKAYELLCLLNGNGRGHIKAYDEYLEKKENFVCDKEDQSPECKKSWVSFWEECDDGKSDNKGWGEWEATYYPEEYKGSTVSSVQYSEKINSNHNKSITELSYDEAIASGWTMTGDGFWIPPQKKDKVKKWILPIEVDGSSGEYFVIFPDDLLEATNLKEGEQVEWIDQGDGSYLLRKVTVTKDDEKI